MENSGTRKPGNGPSGDFEAQPHQPPIAPSPSQPAAAPRQRKRCPECGAETPPKKRGVMKIFCDSKCRARYHARSKARGQPLIPLLLAWRTGRGQTDVAQRAYRELNTILDAFAAEDRAAGRPPAAEYVERLLWMGRHIDRRRR